MTKAYFCTRWRCYMTLCYRSEILGTGGYLLADMNATSRHIVAQSSKQMPDVLCGLCHNTIRMRWLSSSTSAWSRKLSPKMFRFSYARPTSFICRSCLHHRQLEDRNCMPCRSTVQHHSVLQCIEEDLNIPEEPSVASG